MANVEIPASGSARSLFQVRLGGWSCCHDHDLSVEARDRVWVRMALWVCICEEDSNLHILKAVLFSLFYPSWGWHVLLQAFRYFSAFVTNRICSQSEKIKVEIELYESAEKGGKKTWEVFFCVMKGFTGNGWMIRAETGWVWWLLSKKRPDCWVSLRCFQCEQSSMVISRLCVCVTQKWPINAPFCMKNGPQKWWWRSSLQRD